MHKGLDFAAPKGTPIFAAGDGIIEKAGWNGSYGRYIRIRHVGAYETAYAHLSGSIKELELAVEFRKVILLVTLEVPVDLLGLTYIMK